jgi:hypothetical protein
MNLSGSIGRFYFLRKGGGKRRHNSEPPLFTAFPHIIERGVPAALRGIPDLVRFDSRILRLKLMSWHTPHRGATI